MTHLILLSGGSGTRLWPLSNSSRSKQFLKVLRDSQGNHVSMVQRVFSQIRAVGADLDVTIATCADQEFSIRSQVVGDYALVLEPERRDTAPAIMLACAHLAMEQGADAGDTVIVMPIDSYADQAYYDGVVKLDEAVQSGFADLVLLGVEPTYPSEKYGYIVPGDPSGNPRKVARFTEKPDEATAEALISQGALWNCGVFAFRLGYLTAISDGYLKAASFDEFRSRYAELPKISFDYEVVERAQSIGVVPYSGTWKDLGTWNTLTEAMDSSAVGEALFNENCRNVHVINELDVPILCMGLKDVVVSASPNGILVSDKEQSSYIKPYVNTLDQRVMFADKSWGSFRVIDVDDSSMTIKVTLNPGHSMNYHSHSRRDEVWTVISGRGRTVVDGMSQEVQAGDVITMAAGCRHTVFAETELKLIEVQLGQEISVSDKQKFELDD